MRQELDQILCEKYPEIFVNRYADKTTTAMFWGFSCGDGWFNIVERLCGIIQGHIESNRDRIKWCKQTGQEPPEEIPQVVATQVKEKYGTLRFYYDGGDEFIHGATYMAEAMSAKTCEVCGNPGHVRGGGWVRTLCDSHTDE